MAEKIVMKMDSFKFLIVQLSLLLKAMVLDMISGRMPKQSLIKQ